MKFNRYFFVITGFLSAVVLCNAMENNNNQLQKYGDHWLKKDVQEITSILHPRVARYCAKNEVIVGCTGGGVHQLNLKTQATLDIGLVFNYDSQATPMLQANKKKIMIVRGSETVIYDTETGMFSAYLMNIDKEVRSLTWNLSRDTFVLCYGEQGNMITKYNFKADKHKDISVANQICQIMTMHPKKEIMCITDYSGNISLRNIDDTLSKIKTINLSKKLKHSWFCQYSLDGSCIVAGNDSEIFIIDPDADPDTNKDICVNAERKPGIYENFNNIAFHPYGSILAILLNRTTDVKKQLIRYCDLKTGRCIGEFCELDSNESYDICFADNGFEGTVVLPDKCVRIHVPFAIKDKCIYSLCVLNRLNNQTHWPQDINRHCVNILLESFKF